MGSEPLSPSFEHRYKYLISMPMVTNLFPVHPSVRMQTCRPLPDTDINYERTFIKSLIVEKKAGHNELV